MPKYKTNKPEVVAIIPARGGSKGITYKNITNLAGKPLIAYSIMAAKKTNLVDRIIVSTEDQKIADIAMEWGAEVPFLRPKDMAQDNSSVGEAINYTISNLKLNPSQTAYIQLYPTSPFRTPAFIDNMLNILFKGYSSLITVKKIDIDPLFLFIKNKNNSDGKLINLLEGDNQIPSWKKYYRQYSILIANMYQKREKHYYYVITDPCMLIDIDTPHDLRWAEAVIENKLFDFGYEL
ncbi:MAG: acylneuraminate cytidylyltransferase family protein [Desulfamplus sp.]|nr:acylneuraminate cytidylyltransferase family protein [Desulfamplus sp.]